MPSKNDDWFIDQADQRIPRVRQRDAIADSGAVQLFAFFQSANERLLRVGAARNFRNKGNQFAQNIGAIFTFQIQLNRGRRE
jgi:hypothetical protein